MYRIDYLEYKMSKAKIDDTGNRNTLGCALVRMSGDIQKLSETQLKMRLAHSPAYILTNSNLYYFNTKGLTQINVWDDTLDDLDSLFPTLNEGYRFATSNDLSTITDLVKHQHQVPNLPLVESLFDLEQSLASVCIDLMFHKKTKNLDAVELFRSQLNKILHDFNHGIKGDKADPAQYLAYRCKSIFADKEKNKELMTDSSTLNQLLGKINMFAKPSIVANNENFKEKFKAAKDEARQSLNGEDVEAPKGP